MENVNLIAPILLIIYNRPDKVNQLVESLNKFEGLTIYVAADGPKDTESDYKKCEDSRRLIDKLYLKHNVIKNYSNYNQGCGNGCSRAISWFFQSEEMGIIIEDDIAFDEKFLYFATENLNIYKNTNLVHCISGSPYLTQSLGSPSIFLSSYPNIWGWATWRRSWVGYSVNLKNENTLNLINVLLKRFNVLISIYWFFVLMLVKYRKLDSWDHQYYFHMWQCNSYALIPSFPLTNNIGFDLDATCMKLPPKAFEGYFPGNYNHNSYEEVHEISLKKSYDKNVELNTYKISSYTILKLLIKNIIWRSKSWN